MPKIDTTVHEMVPAAVPGGFRICCLKCSLRIQPSDGPWPTFDHAVRDLKADPPKSRCPAIADVDPILKEPPFPHRVTG